MNPITKLTIILWVIFATGILANLLVRAYHAVGNPANPVGTYWGFIKRYRVPIAIRTLISAGLFNYWLGNPGALTHVINYMGLHLNFDLPVTNNTAGLFGFVVDNFLDQLGNVITQKTANIPQLAWVGKFVATHLPPLPEMSAQEKAVVNEQAAQIGEAAQKIQDVTEKP